MDSGFEENVCKECCMRFTSIVDLANHKNKFCKNSEYADPETLKFQLRGSRNTRKMTNSMMTFKQVKEYLKTNDTVLPSVEEGGDMVGQTTLADLKKNMNQNELEMSHLRKKVQRERMEEKAEEVRALKVKQQRIKLQKRKEEEEIKEMMQEVEKRREEELRARIEREAIKKEIKDLDTNGLEELEEERKKQLSKIAKEKEHLMAQENEIIKDIELLEGRVLEQEMQFREEQKQLQASLKNNDDELDGNRRDQVRKRHMQMSKQRGESAAEYKLKKEKLIAQKENLHSKLEHVRGAEEISLKDMDSLTSIVQKVESSEIDSKIASMREAQQREEEEAERTMRNLDTEIYQSTKDGGDDNRSEQIQSYLDDWLQDDIEKVATKEVKTTVALAELEKFRGAIETPKDSPTSVDTQQSPPQQPSPPKNTIPNINIPPPSPEKDALDREMHSQRSFPSNTFSASRQQNTMPPQTESQNSYPNMHSQYAKSPQHRPFGDPYMGHMYGQPPHNYHPTNPSFVPPMGHGPYGAPPYGQPYYSPQPFVPYGHMGPPNYGMQVPPHMYNLYSAGMNFTPPQFANTTPQANGQSAPDPQQAILLAHQEIENAKLQQEIEATLHQAQNSGSSKNVSELDLLIQKLNTKINHMGGSELNTSDEANVKDDNTRHTTSEKMLTNTNGNISGFWSEHASDMEFVERLPEKSELRMMQMQHIEDMAKLQFEKSRLEKKQQLESLRLTFEKEKEENLKTSEHEKWMADQKRRLMALRMTKVISKEQPASVGGFESSKAYNPEEGFTIFWDYALDVPLSCESLQITYAFYERMIRRTNLKVIKNQNCENYGPQSKKCVFSCKRSFEKVPSNPDLRLVVEVANVLKGPPAPNSRPKTIPLGWTMQYIFSGEHTDQHCLTSGHWKLPLQLKTMPDMTRNLPQLPTPIIGVTCLHIRVVHGNETSNSSSFSVDPDVTAGSYSYPNFANAVSQQVESNEESLDDKIQALKAKEEARNKMREVNLMAATAKAMVNSASTSSPNIATPELVDNSNSVKKSFAFKLLQLQVSDGYRVKHSFKMQIYFQNGKSTRVIDTMRAASNSPLWISSTISTSKKGYISINMDTIVEHESFRIGDYVVFSVNFEGKGVIIWGQFCLQDGSRSIDGKQRVPFYELGLAENSSLLNSSQQKAVLDIEISVDGHHSNSNPMHEKAEKAEKAENAKPKPEPVGIPSAKNSSVKPELPALNTNANPEKSRAPPTKPNRSNVAVVPWIKVENPPYSSDKYFAPGDGFNVYIDGARYLPDCASGTKVTVVALAADLSKVETEEFEAFANLSSPVNSPSYDLQAEYREAKFNPTLTLAIRVDTIDTFAKKPMIVGYALLNVFLDPTTKTQPAKSTAQDFLLNVGSFQLPIRAGIALNPDDDFNVSATKDYFGIPCATILVRITQAKRSSNGLTVLSRSSIPKRDWEKKGIVDKAPSYLSRAYDSTLCKPTMVENEMYKIKAQGKAPLASSSLQSLHQNGDTAVEEWFKKELSAKPSDSVALSTLFLYQSSIGFRVSIDGLHNMPSKLSFFKALFCLSPPAPLYQDPKLTEDVQFTTTTDWNSAQHSPSFLDGYFTYRDVDFDEKNCLLIDVRSIARDKKSGKYTSAPLGWCAAPLMNSFGNISSGNFLIPIVQGEFLKSYLDHDLPLLELIATECAKPKGLFKYLDGASVFLRIEDIQAQGIFPTPFEKVSLDYLPLEKQKYAFDASKTAALAKKKPVRKFLKTKGTEKATEKEINVAFAAEMDISHYTF